MKKTGLMVFASLMIGAPVPVHGQTVWVKPPSEAAFKNTPGLQHHTFESEFMKTEVGYCVILPQSRRKLNAWPAFTSL